MKKLCECGNEGLPLGEIEKSGIMVFGKIPIKEIVKTWYKMGYKKTEIVCEGCLIK